MSCTRNFITTKNSYLATALQFPVLSGEDQDGSCDQIGNKQKEHQCAILNYRYFLNMDSGKKVAPTCSLGSFESRKHCTLELS